MKEEDLRKSAVCLVCGKPFGSTGLPLFYRVKIERHAVDMKAVQRQQGLAMMLGGNGMLAPVMGPDEDMTDVLSSYEFTVCEDCSTKQICIAELAERGANQNEVDEEEEEGS
jgi:hypothetical protein